MANDLASALRQLILEVQRQEAKHGLAIEVVERASQADPNTAARFVIECGVPDPDPTLATDLAVDESTNAASDVSRVANPERQQAGPALAMSHDNRDRKITQSVRVLPASIESYRGDQLPTWVRPTSRAIR